LIDLSVTQDGKLPGQTLMDEDARLLQAADEGIIGPTLRFYEWDVPTLSLGYHQDAAVLDGERLEASHVPWVRRPTGGAAVLHSEELTYAIVLPNCGAPGAASVVQEYVSKAIALGLRRAGVAADVDSRGEPLSALPNRTSCFVRTSRWEVTASGRKIVGSAQRKLARGLLQHGSILTGEDHLRIVDFLRMSDDSSREALRTKLRGKATSASTELSRPVDPSELRMMMAGSFLEVFAEFPADLLHSSAEI
jgi:lipoate-protein ligase A